MPGTDGETFEGWPLAHTYVSQQALQVAGPVREIYHVGPRDTDDSSQWRTEIGWRIFQTASADDSGEPAEEDSWSLGTH